MLPGADRRCACRPGAPWSMSSPCSTLREQALSCYQYSAQTRPRCLARPFPHSQAVCAGQGHCTLARQHLQFPDDLPCVDLGSVDLTVQQMEGIAKFLNQRFEAGISLPPAAPALSSRSAGLLRGLGTSGRVGACAEGGSPVALPSCGCCQVQCSADGRSAMIDSSQKVWGDPSSGPPAGSQAPRLDAVKQA